MIPDTLCRLAAAALLAACLANHAAAEPPAGDAPGTGWRGFAKSRPLSGRSFTPASDAKPLAVRDRTRPALSPTDDVIGSESQTESRAARGSSAITRVATDASSATDRLPDPLAGTEQIAVDSTGPDAETILARLLPPRSDSWSDWSSGLEPLHACGEPRALAPCVPPPPCHPANPPQPLDLVGVHGTPSCGPIYSGPCAPRTGTHDDAHLPWLHRAYDRFFDCFYRTK